MALSTFMPLADADPVVVVIGGADSIEKPYRRGGRFLGELPGFCRDLRANGFVQFNPHFFQKCRKFISQATKMPQISIVLVFFPKKSGHDGKNLLI
jgi:hypothetical protein